MLGAQERVLKGSEEACMRLDLAEREFGDARVVEAENGAKNWEGALSDGNVMRV